MTDIPHFSSAFALTAAGAAVDEQDSVAELEGCARNIAVCPRGFRADLPDFGIDDPTFTAAVDTAAIEQAIERWDPRVVAEVTDSPAAPGLDPSQRSVTIAIGVRA